jgi:hypothetical protein
MKILNKEITKPDSGSQTLSSEPCALSVDHPPEPLALSPEPHALRTLEIRSPELQEVMTEIPGSFLRWGLFLFFGIIVILVSISYIIKYPVIVTAPVTITTINSPASLVARSGGKITELFVNNDDFVDLRSHVALIENPALYVDVMKIDTFLETFRKESDWQNRLSDYQLPSGLMLGEIQSSFTHFVSAWHQLDEYVKQAYIPSKILLLQEQIDKQSEYASELLVQKRLSEEDLIIQKNSYNRDSMLKSSLSISNSDLEKSKQSLLQRQSSHSSLKANIKNNEAAILRMKEIKLDLKVQFEKEMHQYLLSLDEALQLLKVSIDEWINKYLIESPVKGKITFTSFWNKNQVIKTGDVLATVIPEDGNRIIVRAKVPISGLGRVKLEQQVNIKLSGYPYMEFGVIKGRIKSLSQVPVEGFYIAEIDLVNGMKSTYNRKIQFIQEMDGTADIITERTRLIYKFINPMRSVVQNQ